VKQHARAAGAECFADGELTLPGIGADQHEVGDVRARDEQNEHRGRGDHPQGAIDAPCHVFTKRHHDRDRLGLIEQHLRRDAGCHLRIDLGDSREHGGKIALGLGHAHSWTEPCHRIEVETARELRGWIELQRQPELRLFCWKAKALRHDAHDLTTEPVHVDVASDDRSVATETVAKELLAEDHQVRPVRHVLGVGEDAAKDGRDLQRGYERGRDPCCGHALRLTAAARLGEIHRAFLVDADVLDGSGKPLIREVGALGLIRLLDGEQAEVVPGADEPVRVAVWQRSQEHSVEDREDGDARPNADDQHEGCSSREDRCAAE
jgi:hypothetical protein